jgi:ribonuclease HI
MGAMLSPFVRIGGHLTFQPPLCAHLQTDASFHYHPNRQTRVAAILKTADERAIYKETWNVGSRRNSTEGEWISILKGLEFAIEKKQDAVTIENDCLSIIYHLTTQAQMRLGNSTFYEKHIRQLANDCAWVGIRWIPRQMNQADKLLR